MIVRVLTVVKVKSRISKLLSRETKNSDKSNQSQENIKLNI